MYEELVLLHLIETNDMDNAETNVIDDDQYHEHTTDVTKHVIYPFKVYVCTYVSNCICYYSYTVTGISYLLRRLERRLYAETEPWSLRMMEAER